MASPTDRDACFAAAERALEEYLARVAAGEALAFEDWCAAHAEVRDELRELFALCGDVRTVSDRTVPSGDPLVSRRGPDARDRFVAPQAFATRYRVADEIGRGAMGSVVAIWDHHLGRELAMKVILADPAHAPSAPRVSRFWNEARITSQLDHPGIVPVHEMGLDPAGRPFFTMKRVRGRTLRYVFDACADGHPDWSRARVLALLLRAFEAVAYAHERGVIHRDLKPANIMVGDFGEVYVMDWGLAKRVGERDERDIRPRSRAAPASEADDATATLETMDGDALGTPAYMAPEQARGRIDAMGPHSDVYAFGAMLHHLIAGHAPYCAPHESTNPHVILQRVIAGPPHAIPADAAPPELVAIAERAMAREPAQRYANVKELATDLGAFLEGRVVRAYESGSLAELRKWIGRNRALSAAVAATVLSLVLGLIAFALKSAQAEALAAAEQGAKNAAIAAKNDLQRREADLQRAVDYQGSLLSTLDAPRLGRSFLDSLRHEVVLGDERRARAGLEDVPRVVGFDRSVNDVNAATVASDVVVREMLTPASRRLAESLDSALEVQAVLRVNLSVAFWSIGAFELSEEEARLAWESFACAGMSTQRSALGALAMIGRTLLLQQRFTEAEPFVKQGLALRRAHLGPDDPDTIQSMNDLASVYTELGFLEDAESLFEDVLTRWRRIEGNPTSFATFLGNFADLYRRTGRDDEALPLLRQVLDIQERHLGPDHTDTLKTLFVLLHGENVADRLPDWFQKLADVRDRLARKFGDLHPDVITSRGAIAGMLIERGDVEQAARLQAELVEATAKLRGPFHSDTARAMNDLAVSYQVSLRLREAEALSREAHALFETDLGPDHPETLRALGNLAETLRREGRHEEARVYSETTLSGWSRQKQWNRGESLHALSNYGVLLVDMGDTRAARVVFADLHARSARHFGSCAHKTLLAQRNLAAATFLDGDREAGVAMLREALAARIQAFGEADDETLDTHGALAFMLARAGALDEALVHAERAYQGLVARHGLIGVQSLIRYLDLADVHGRLGLAARASGDEARATAWLTQAESEADSALQTLRALLGPDSLAVWNAQRIHAATLKALRRYGAAEASMLEANAALVRLVGEDARILGVSNSELVDLYAAWAVDDPTKDLERARWAARAANPGSR